MRDNLVYQDIHQHLLFLLDYISIYYFLQHFVIESMFRYIRNQLKKLLKHLISLYKKCKSQDNVSFTIGYCQYNIRKHKVRASSSNISFSLKSFLQCGSILCTSRMSMCLMEYVLLFILWILFV